MAVDVFMIISGYLMAAQSSTREGTESLTKAPDWWLNWRIFWTRRYFRLAPAYYISLLAVVLMGQYFLSGYQTWRNLNPQFWVNDDGVYDLQRISFSAENIALHISFLFGLHPTWSFSTFLPDWSLSLEMQFYLIFPVLWMMMRKWGDLIVGIVLGVSVFAVGQFVMHRVTYYEPSFLPFGLNCFLAGMVAHAAITRTRRRWQRLALEFAAMFLVSLGVLWRGHQWLVLPVLMALMLLLAWHEKQGRLPAKLHAAMDSHATHLASDMSYGIYLFHGFFIAIAGYAIGHFPLLRESTFQVRSSLLFLFVSIGSFSTAWLFHRLVELPGIRLGHLVIARLRKGNRSNVSPAGEI